MLIQQYCDVFEKDDLDFIISPTALGEEPPRIEDVLN